MNKNLIQSKDKALKKLDNLISNYIQKNETNAYFLINWINQYSHYLKNNITFNPKRQMNYYRGAFIKIDFGYNIGAEFSRIHYAIVINNPDKSSELVTVIPLTSEKENKTMNNRFCVNLGDSLIKNIYEKLNKISLNCTNFSTDYKNLNETKNINKYNDDLKLLLSELESIKKCNSIALVGNITTINKQRILTPTLKHRQLENIYLSEEQLNLIDKKIIELYTGN